MHEIGTLERAQIEVGGDELLWDIWGCQRQLERDRDDGFTGMAALVAAERDDLIAEALRRDLGGV